MRRLIWLAVALAAFLRPAGAGRASAYAHATGRLLGADHAIRYAAVG